MFELSHDRRPRPLVIFTEGDRARGLGHISRCKALARTYRDLTGGEGRWVVDGDATAHVLLAGEAVEWRRWQEQTDFDGLETVVAVVDSYALSRQTMQAIAARAAVPVFVDDLMRNDYPGGWVLHFAPTARRPRGSAARWLMGPRWRPLPTLSVEPSRRGAPSPQIAKALVLMGGTDVRDLGPRMAALARSSLPGAQVTLVCGAGARAVVGEGFEVQRALEPEQMRDLMLANDLAITASGQTLFELARCGLPAVAIDVAWNQTRHLEQWAAAGTVISAGSWAAPDLDERVRSGLRSLEPVEARARCSTIGQRLTRANGWSRLSRRASPVRVFV